MKILGTITITDRDQTELLIFTIAFLAMLLGGMVATWWANFRRRRRDRPPEFVFRSIENLGPRWAGGDNPWHGALVCEQHVDAITGELLRAAVERYQARNPPPIDGDRFMLQHGELWKL